MNSSGCNNLINLQQEFPKIADPRYCIMQTLTWLLLKFLKGYIAELSDRSDHLPTIAIVKNCNHFAEKKIEYERYTKNFNLKKFLINLVTKLMTINLDCPKNFANMAAEICPIYL